MNNRVEKALNEQIHKEASSSQYYLAMASWSENNGLNGTAKFMYTHSDEERFHMLKLVKFVNERGGKAVIPSVEKPPLEFSTLKNVFESLLKHEIGVTESINNLVDVCLQEKDYTTHNFVQWYVAEQHEEEKEGWVWAVILKEQEIRQLQDHMILAISRATASIM